MPYRVLPCPDTFQLPYTHTDAKKGLELAGHAGAIHYEADEADDIDEEDPDDDLDI